jgi:hypothetical protein
LKNSQKGDISAHTERLLEALISGAVPIILSCSGDIRLPLDESIDWKKAVFQFPLSRMPELPFTIHSLSPGIFEILENAIITITGSLVVFCHFFRQNFYIIRLSKTTNPIEFLDNLN